ncbi:putative aldouronate transport system substrate-binding protein [Paenibacillus catalpae]|uniref:Putative aldouronate transport system substrate-binding protein n=2 Tax=Paenibacillus catalpae TaxID=1045775 RepID=A0A1I2EXE6_9BACL|nr:putative aldouronate transport system substrate-binding protein [Paenibacillus catalpae]
MMKKHRIIALLLTAILAISGLTGCKSTENNGEQSAVLEKIAGQAPAASGDTLTYWAELNGNAASVKPRFQDVPFFQEWQKRTGVKLKFIQPPSNQAKQALNVMLASGELPDMIEYEWANFPGGPEKAIKDGYILRLNDLIDQYAPNLKRYLSEHPDIDKQIKTADGSYYVFPFIQGDPLLRTYQGPIIRKDWLEELGLSVPVTIDDWYTVLQTFKEKKGVKAPLTFLSTPSPLFGVENGAFVGAFGVKKGFYLKNGQVKFGPIEPGYRQFLALFREWYAEGLIDRNIATVDTRTIDSSMMSGRSGASIWNAGSGIGTWLPLLKEKDPKAEFVAAPYPVLHKGERPMFGQRVNPYMSSGGVAISAKSSHAAEAVRMLDYGYGEEGHLLFNFGIEGVSYTMKNGRPTYTDLILHNPDKLAPSQAIAMYSRASYFGPFVQDVAYMEQYYMLQVQKDAVSIWSDTDAETYMLPPVQKTERESAEFSAIMQDVTTLVDEMSLRIILGIDPLESYEDYVAQLKALNIDRAVAIQKAALDRYNAK